MAKDTNGAAVAVDVGDGNKVEAAVAVGDVNVNPSVDVGDVSVKPAVALSANGNALFSSSNKKDHSKESTDNSQNINIINKKRGVQHVENVGNRTTTTCSII